MASNPGWLVGAVATVLWLAEVAAVAPTEAPRPAKTMQPGTLGVTIAASVLAAVLLGTVIYLRVRHHTTSTSYAPVHAAHM